ncbi:PP2C family serine/threonine-protein phosphatase [Streptomyces sp. JHA26]|uniref:PP2C family serine/threonine-protein phosphatase n=1 Tax=Streptomyces sp. JHA26 TaxID=1917143 RepID=UPI00209AD102|nr:PP2C family serine/threonine-protein phosphatase [Streptomyces sp. JHA26]
MSVSPEREPASWRVHGTKVTGYRHLRDDLPCQDAWGMRRSSDSLVLVVADGAGSAARAEEGARQVVRLAVEAFAPLATPWDRIPDANARKHLMTEAFRSVRTNFLHWCGSDPAPFATTLTVVVAAQGWLGHVSVGDGLVLLRTGGDGSPAAHHLLPQPAGPSEYANETVFVGSAAALGHVLVDCVRDPGIDGVLLSTDGLTNVLVKRTPSGFPLPHDAFVGRLFERLARPDYDHDEEERWVTAFLGSDQVNRVTGDDKTLLWAIRT